MKGWLRLCAFMCCMSLGVFADEQEREVGEEVSGTEYQKAKEIIAKHHKVVNAKSADEKTGILIGMSIGGGLPYSGKETAGDSISSAVVSAGIMGGYQKFFSPHSGIRAYVSLHSGKGFASSKGTNDTPVKQSFTMLSLNIDGMVGMSIGEDKTKSLGLIGGLGYAALSYDDNFSGLDGSKSGAVVNVGVFFSAGKHRFEALAKILPLDYVNMQNDAGKTSLTNVLGTLGYSYVF
ncbi:hypothetical protein OQH61_04255 [Helicobacter sp. MIT 21-1697]|uniref:outer membrane beta-barrel protein n=1 Tax=Helicobacter sp. MIT 21-1697 TaxID=2993733 RepID=UPI00224A74B2|nr:outer membrane beta-barrel protein [Helicobacter sp. MIT 21-1697]MCX2716944.1 hypothetical protein [Helicobacter sp. MIT 21-1697]